jgi:uncharacterized membrane protein
MDILTTIFGHLCGQGRCFVVDGTPLPVCQRCTGLYVGALLTGVWLLASGVRRRGVPPASLAWAYGAVLIAALLGGVHTLDFGPRWRLLCGLWTGQVALVWLYTGATQLSVWARRASAELSIWTRREKSAAWIALALTPVIALAWPTPLRGPWSVWAGAIVGGAALSALVLVRAVTVWPWCAARLVWRWHARA